MKLNQERKEVLLNLWVEQNLWHLVSGLEFNMMNRWENMMACKWDLKLFAWFFTCFFISLHLKSSSLLCQCCESFSW